MDPADLLNNVVKIVAETADEIMDRLYGEASQYSIEASDLIHIIKDFTLRGGKRLRAFLVLIGYWSVDWGSDIEKIRYLMTGIEFLQSYLLVHDDIMDRDLVRRGGPTVHKWFSDKCFEKRLIGDCKHYGVSQAIVSGDYLETLAIYCFTKLELSRENLSKLLERYTRGLRLVSYGQYLDVLMSMKPLHSVCEKDVYTIHMLKTASYTVELPLHLGAIASEKYSDELLYELSRYALPAGIAFQMRDDILGLYGREEVTGKPMGSDVREKKKTLLVVKAYENASEEDRMFLEDVFDRRKREEIGEEDVIRVQEIVKKTGAYDYVTKVMENEALKARNALYESRLMNENAKKALLWLLEYFIKREK